MNETEVRSKLKQVKSGAVVVMSDAELDWLADNNLQPKNVVSMPNPKQVGTLDGYLVGKLDCPAIQAERAVLDLRTSASRAPQGTLVWDEPKGAASARGWYWPQGTRRGETSCAGHYLDYGVDHRRYDEQQVQEPGHIHCVVVTKATGRTYAARYVETADAARRWIEQQAVKAGYPA